MFALVSEEGGRPKSRSAYSEPSILGSRSHCQSEHVREPFAAHVWWHWKSYRAWISVQGCFLDLRWAETCWGPTLVLLWIRSKI